MSQGSGVRGESCCCRGNRPNVATKDTKPECPRVSQRHQYYQDEGCMSRRKETLDHGFKCLSYSYSGLRQQMILTVIWLITQPKIELVFISELQSFLKQVETVDGMRLCKVLTGA